MVNKLPISKCRLYAFVDAAYLHGRDPVHLAECLCRGGADLIQLRAKSWTADQIVQTARAIKPITDAAGVYLVVNDLPQAARDAGADFCHLGQEDFFAAGFRQKQEAVGHDINLGLSTHRPQEALKAIDAGADYIAIGPVFPTPTKPGRPAVTLEYVRWAAAHVTAPWFAIGGINLQNVEQVLAAGARRICVVSAILNAPDVVEACRTFKDCIPSLENS